MMLERTMPTCTYISFIFFQALREIRILKALKLQNHNNIVKLFTMVRNELTVCIYVRMYSVLVIMIESVIVIVILC